MPQVRKDFLPHSEEAVRVVLVPHEEYEEVSFCFFLLIWFGLVCFALRERKKEEREVLISGGIFQNNTQGIGSFFVSHSSPLPFPLQFSASSLYCDWFNGRIAVRYRLGSQTKKKPKHFTFYGTKRADIFLFFSQPQV